jgi:LAO/AO transport system kinase
MTDQRNDEQEDAHAGAESNRDATGSRPGGALSVRPGVDRPSDPSSIPSRGRRELTIDQHVDGILAGDRVILGKTITLVESRRPDHHDKALEVLERLMPHTGRSIRIGITGVPGVGKSSFIESFGTSLTSAGHRLAVLAIDPSSLRSRGSILGDKTRMERLSVDPNAFIRPSPSAGSLGGVAQKTREAMLICEAAGFDVILIETVGVGQSETMVHSMVDVFLLLMLAGAGDELQGIKRGIMELADLIVINKADGENVTPAARARAQYETAVHLLSWPLPDWTPPVQTCSALTGAGIEEAWETISRFRATAERTGFLQEKRRTQNLSWMRDAITEALRDRFHANRRVSEMLPGLEHAVSAGDLPPLLAARRVLDAFFRDRIDEH